jgi:hypothetical protein
MVCPLHPAAACDDGTCPMTDPSDTPPGIAPAATTDQTHTADPAPYGEWGQHATITFDDTGMPTAKVRHHQVMIVAYQDGEDDFMLHVEVHADAAVPIGHEHPERHGLRPFDADHIQVSVEGPDRFVIDSLWATVTVTYQPDEGSTFVLVEGSASVERHDFDPRWR